MTDPLVRLTREVARSLGDGPGPARRRRQRLAVARLTRAAPAPARAASWWLVPLFATIAAAIFVTRTPATPSSPMTATIGAQSVMVGAWLAAPEREALVVDFSDRSRAALTPGSTARLLKLDPTRVELNLERGSVTLDIQPPPDRTFILSAGPFTVTLDDAETHATWSPGTGALVVEVERGHAEVTRDTSPTRITAGHRLELRDPQPLGTSSLKDGTPAASDLSPGTFSSTTSSDLSPGTSSSPTSTAGAAARPRTPPATSSSSPPSSDLSTGTSSSPHNSSPGASPSPRDLSPGTSPSPRGLSPGTSSSPTSIDLSPGTSSSPAKTDLSPGTSPSPTSTDLSPGTSSSPAPAPPRPRDASSSPARPSWIELAEAGDHRAALAAAERLGFLKLHATLDVAALDLLARSARLAGEGPRARDALLALRRRFPADVRARTAAFLLGRVALDLEADAPRAREWFTIYLSEAPGGPLAADARRRLDELGPIDHANPPH